MFTYCKAFDKGMEKPGGTLLHILAKEHEFKDQSKFQVECVCVCVCVYVG
jgi:hypothetical protein